MENELAVSTDWVREQMQRGEPIFFVEVRHAGDRDLAVMKARGALRLTSSDVQDHVGEIPKERAVVVYSTAPVDEPAALFVKLLARQGYTNARLLIGGFKGYLSAGLPVEEIGEGHKMQRLRGL